MERTLPHHAYDRLLRLVPVRLRWLIPWSQRHHLHHRSTDERELDHEHHDHDTARHRADTAAKRRWRRHHRDDR